MTLKELQTHFVCALLQTADENELAKWIAARPFKRAADNMQIYCQSRQARFAKVLQATFPVCKTLVGEDYFKLLCFHYTKYYTPSSHDITFYGIQFAKFLLDPRFKQHLDYLPDVAHLEWACFNLIHQAYASPLDGNALSQVTQEKYPNLKFSLGYSQLVKSDYPIGEIWQQHQVNKEISIDLKIGGCHLFVYKRGWEVVVDKLNPQEYELLSCFSQGLSFEQTWLHCEEAFSDVELTALFAKAVERGWITEFYF